MGRHEALFFARERVAEAPPVREHCGAVYGRPDRAPRKATSAGASIEARARGGSCSRSGRGIASPQRGQCVRCGLDSSSVCQQRGHRNIRFVSGMSMASSAASLTRLHLRLAPSGERKGRAREVPLVQRLHTHSGREGRAREGRPGTEAPSRSFRRPRVSAGSKPRSTHAGDATSTGMRPRGCSARGRGPLR